MWHTCWFLDTCGAAAKNIELKIEKKRAYRILSSTAPSRGRESKCNHEPQTPPSTRDDHDHDHHRDDDVDDNDDHGWSEEAPSSPEAGSSASPASCRREETAWGPWCLDLGASSAASRISATRCCTHGPPAPLPQLPPKRPTSLSL